MRIGDRVRVIAKGGVYGRYSGITGTITKERVNDIHSFYVEFDEPFYDEDFDFLNSEGHVYMNPYFDGVYLPSDCLELLQPNKTEV